MSIKSYLPVLLLLLLVGCAGERDADSESADATPADPRLVLSVGVHHTDVSAREPMLVEHPSGTLFLAGYGSQVTGTNPRSVPHLWRSDDAGVSWKRVDVGTPEEGAIGNSDVDLTVGPDGAIYFREHGLRSERARRHARGDRGESATSARPGRGVWSRRPSSTTGRGSRIAPEGTAHAIWNDGAGISLCGQRAMVASELARSAIGFTPRAARVIWRSVRAGELAVRISPIAASGNRFERGGGPDRGESATAAPAGR